MSKFFKINTEARTNLLLLTEKENKDFLKTSKTKLNSVDPFDIIKKYEYSIEIKNPSISCFTPNSFLKKFVVDKYEKEFFKKVLFQKKENYKINSINNRKIGIAWKKFEIEKERLKIYQSKDDEISNKSISINYHKVSTYENNFMTKDEFQAYLIQKNFDFLQNLAFSLKKPKKFKSNKNIINTLITSKKKGNRCQSERKIINNLKFNKELFEILEFKDIKIDYKKYQRKNSSFKTLDSQFNTKEVTPFTVNTTKKDYNENKNILNKLQSINFEPVISSHHQKIQTSNNTDKSKVDLERSKFEESPKKWINSNIKSDNSFLISQISPIHNLNDDNLNSQKLLLKDEFSQNVSDFDLSNTTTPQHHTINNRPLTKEYLGSGKINCKDNIRMVPSHFELNKKEFCNHDNTFNKSSDIVIISDKSHEEMKSIISCDVKYLSSVTENTDSKLNESYSCVSKITVEYSVDVINDKNIKQNFC